MSQTLEELGAQIDAINLHGRALVFVVPVVKELLWDEAALRASTHDVVDEELTRVLAKVREEFDERES